MLVEKDQITPAEIITGPVGGSILFEGVGMQLDSGNELVFPIVFGSASSYSWYPEEPITEYPMALGNDLVLVAGLQARNNGNIMFILSITVHV